MYYVLIVQNKATQAVFRYDSIEAAQAKYHEELAYRAEGRTSTDCAILDSDLHMLRQETYVAPNTDNTEEPVEG